MKSVTDFRCIAIGVSMLSLGFGPLEPTDASAQVAESAATTSTQQNLALELIERARKQLNVTTGYDGSYKKLTYPGGDVDISTGVCTDVVVRAYRGIGFDLQKLVHEDMKANFSSYPSRKIWGLKRPDRNIDHRRVPNLETFFSRKGQKLKKNTPLKAGDILTWMLPGNLPHIGIVSDRRDARGENFLVIHNIGQGTQEEDIVGSFERTGHYRFPAN